MVVIENMGIGLTYINIADFNTLAVQRSSPWCNDLVNSWILEDFYDEAFCSYGANAVELKGILADLENCMDSKVELYVAEF